MKVVDRAGLRRRSDYSAEQGPNQAFSEKYFPVRDIFLHHCAKKRN